MQRRLFLAGAAALVSPAAVGAGASRTLREGMGLNVRFAFGQPMRDLVWLQDLGVRWVRDGLPWRVVEPAAGAQAVEPRDWRQRLQHYREHGIGLVCTLSLSNDVAYPPTVEQPYRHVDPQAFGAHAARMSRMLREAGLRYVLEIGNEPHNGFLPELVGGDWSGRPPSPWVDHYVRLCEAAVKAVKAVDPAARLLSDDDMWITHYRYLDAGQPAGIDGYAVHPYGPTGPERTTDPDGAWMRPHRIADADRSLASAVRRLRAQGERRTGRRPEIWLTEWGWAEGLPSPRQLTERTQAARLQRAYVIAEAAGVQALCWYSLRDLGKERFGLLDARGRQRLSFTAMQRLSAELGDWSLRKQLIGQESPTQGLQAYLFERAGATRLIAWNADEAPLGLELSGPLLRSGLRDGLGEPVSGRAVGHAEHPALRLEVDGLPVLIDGPAEPWTDEDWQRHVG